jgi:type II secretory pathway pseudopilin PulG
MKKNGFGLLEVLLSSGLIAILIGGAVILGAVVFRTTQVNQHKTQAMYLNQEAIEAVKQIQRSNWVKQDATVSWNNSLDAGERMLLAKDKGWSLLAYNKEGSSKILNEVTFYRKITITDVTADKNLITDSNYRSSNIIKKLESEVTWDDFGKTYSTKIQTLVSDWKAL